MSIWATFFLGVEAQPADPDLPPDAYRWDRYAIRDVRAVAGALPAWAPRAGTGAYRLEAGRAHPATGTLRGVTEHLWYTTRAQKTELQRSIPERTGDDTMAVLIPIRKSEAWWDLPQDE